MNNESYQQNVLANSKLDNQIYIQQFSAWSTKLIALLQTTVHRL